MGLLRGWVEIVKKKKEKGKGRRKGEMRRKKREFIFYLVVLDHMGK